MTTERRIQRIEERNARVERDKAWETSLTRRFAITVITYAIVVALLHIIESPRPWSAALVPALGYALSTLLLPPLRARWEEYRGTHGA